MRECAWECWAALQVALSQRQQHSVEQHCRLHLPPFSTLPAMWLASVAAP